MSDTPYHAFPSEEEASGGAAPSAPLLRESPPATSLDELEAKVMREFSSIRKLMQQHRQPTTNPQFEKAVETNNWNEAIKLLTSVTLVQKATLKAIFEIRWNRNMNYSQMTFWKEFLKKAKITPEQLSKIYISNYSVNALQLLICFGDDLEIFNWVKTNATDKALQKLTSKVNQGDSLVAWMAYWCKVPQLKFLAELSYKDGRSVFPVTSSSDWDWKKFRGEVSAGGHNRAQKKECFKFWGEFIAIQL